MKVSLIFCLRCIGYPIFIVEAHVVTNNKEADNFDSSGMAPGAESARNRNKKY
jgi:hypothetical protein